MYTTMLRLLTCTKLETYLFLHAGMLLVNVSCIAERIHEVCR